MLQAAQVAPAPPPPDATPFCVFLTLFFVGVGLLCAGLIWLVQQAEKRRTRSVRDWATPRGHAFDAAATDVLPRLATLPLLSSSRNVRLRNHVRGVIHAPRADSGGVNPQRPPGESSATTPSRASSPQPFELFDYEFSAGVKHRIEIHRTLIVLPLDPSSRGHVPGFVVRPAWLIDRLNDVISRHPPITLRGSPEQTAPWRVYANPDVADRVAALFDARVLASMDAFHKSACAECDGRHLMVFRRRWLKRPAELDEFLDRAIAVRAALLESASAAC